MFPMKVWDCDTDEDQGPVSGLCFVKDSLHLQCQFE